VKGLGANMVQIDMPSVNGSTALEKVAKAEEIRKIIRTTGALEFRILATKRDNESLIERAKVERMKVPVNSPKTVTINDAKTGKEIAKWCRVRDQEVDKIKNDDAALKVGTIKVKDKDDKEVARDVWEVLVLDPESEAYNVNGADIRDARARVDQETARPEILLSFSSSGGMKFGRVTGEHLPIGDFRHKLAIVLDDVLQTAPTIQSRITVSGRITGNFTQKEVDEIVRIINAGGLPAALEPTPVRDTIVEGAVSK
jgi:SecD/SecF fusion protein